jgi:hypothetical protein
MSKVTFKQEWLQRNATAMQQVCDLLGWTEQEYCQYQFDTGIAYTHWYMATNADYRTKLQHSGMYWSWFKNQWLLYDESWLSFKRSLQECKPQTLLQLYHDLHCPHAMAVETKPTEVLKTITSNETRFKIKVRV